MDPTSQLRNIKDFLTVYNKMTEHCFTKCISNFNYRSSTSEEKQCINVCSDRHLKCNQRLIQQFMQQNPEVIQRRIDEAQQRLDQATAMQSSSEVLNSEIETNNFTTNA